jgi:hypothetical protein
MSRRSKAKEPKMRNNALPFQLPLGGDYKVGPGRPPKEYQFKPGQSGNPKGARRKPRSLVPDLKALLERALNRRVTLRQGEHERIITKAEAGIEQLVNQFAKGDSHARRDLIALAGKLGVDLMAGHTEAIEQVLAADRQAILDAYVARKTGRKDLSAPCPVLAPPELVDDNTPDEIHKRVRK